MSIFGSRKPYMGAQIREDANAPKLLDLLGQSTGETQMPWMDAPQAMPQKRSFFGQGGIGRLIAGSIGDALTQNAGMGTPFQDAQQLRQRQEYEDELYQRRNADQWAQFVRQQQFKRENPEPRYFEANNGDQYTIGTDGKPQLVFKDPTPKVNWVRADNGDGTFTMVPMQMGGQQTQPQGNLPAIGSVVPDPRKPAGGQGGPYSNVVDPAGEAAMIRTLGRAGYEQWKRKYGLQVTGGQ